MFASVAPQCGEADVGLDVSRTNHGDMHAIAFLFRAQGFKEAMQGELGGGVA